MREDPELKSVAQSLTSTTESSQNDDRLLDNILSEGDSYETLKTSSSGGTHFQFKFEKLWTLTNAPVHARFRVQISSLASNFSSIPFSERRSLNSEFFKEKNSRKLWHEKLLKDSSASALLEEIGRIPEPTVGDNDYEFLSLSQELDELDKKWLEVVNNSAVSENAKCSTPFNCSDMIKEEEPDAAVNNTSNSLNNIQINANQQVKQAQSSEHNLEDWLDSILDD